ncbi:MAG: rhomboid family intramembrane serine protease [Lachnospiraceae bacterium]|nr:rhomboid family intramembrane serine protease [Lachnospiraceae bacterium]
MEHEQLEHLLTEQGFYKVSLNLPEFTFFFHPENAYVNVLQVIDYHQGIYISTDQYEHIKELIRKFFQNKNINNVHLLSLIVSADIGKAKQLCVDDTFCWLIDPMGNRLIIHENQVADFYGMKDILENFLYAVANESYANPETCYSEKPTYGETGPVGAALSGVRKNILCWGNIILVAANVILFIVCMFTGDWLYKTGAFSIRNVIEDREWYRIVTSMFLHADIQHLFSNMLILYYIGNVVEKHIGCVPYMIIYFLSGIVGNMLSAGYEMLTGSYVSSVGASGAVFGIEGALLMLVIIYKGKCAEVTTGRLVFAIAFSLYCGFSSSNINNAAHIGGVLAGFVAAGICWLLIPEKRKKECKGVGRYEN